MQMQLIYFLVILFTCIPEYHGAKREAWTDLIPEKDLKKAAIQGLDDALLTLDPNFFQGDLRGCTESKSPPCPPLTSPDVYRWNKITANRLIPFMVSPELAEILDLINSAHDSIQAKTCLLLFDDGAENEKQFISYEKGDICASDWGGIKKNKIKITMNTDCVDGKVGNIQHLLLHALGLLKEHTRNDRDNFIVIYWENVQAQREADFRMDDSSTSYDFDYDYESVLHPNYFFLSKSQALPTISGTTKVSIGQRERLSNTDALKLNRTYCYAKAAKRSGIPSGIAPSKAVTMGGNSKKPKVITVTQVETVQIGGDVTTSIVTKEIEKDVLKTVFHTVTETVQPTQAVNQRIRVIATTEPPPETDTGEDTGETKGSPISPTPSGACVDRFITSTNLQTMSRTTVYGAQTSWTHKTKMHTIMNTGQLEAMLATGPVYQEFDGPVAGVETSRLNDLVLTLRTHYQQQILNDGRTLQQEKFETRTVRC